MPVKNHLRAHIRMNNQTDAMSLVQALSDMDDAFYIENLSCTLRVNAKSIVGVMYAMTDYNDETYLVNDTRNGVYPRVVDGFRI